MFSLQNKFNLKKIKLLNFSLNISKLNWKRKLKSCRGRWSARRRRTAVSWKARCTLPSRSGERCSRIFLIKRGTILRKILFFWIRRSNQKLIRVGTLKHFKISKAFHNIDRLYFRNSERLPSHFCLFLISSVLVNVKIPLHSSDSFPFLEVFFNQFLHPKMSRNVVIYVVNPFEL